jgi:hypothetical protein
VLARYRIVGGNLAGLYVVAGPELGVNLKSRVRNKRDGYAGLEGNVPRIQPGLVAGAGFTYLRVEFDVRWKRTTGWDSLETADSPGVRMRGNSVGAALGIRL